MIKLADIQGHWVRRWIKAPGFEDHTTLVHWMQAGPVYADVRVPLVRPLVSGQPALSHVPPQGLLTLLQGEGFAGRVTLKDSQCTWHRHINWHGKPDTLDMGHIAFDDESRMIETGVHADYTELWQQLPSQEHRSLEFSGGGYAGFMVSNGPQFVLGIGKPDKPSTKQDLATLEAGAIPQGIDSLFDGIHALGHMAGTTGTATLATNPFYEGQTVITLTQKGAIWHRIGFDGTRSAVELHSEAMPE